MGLSTKGPITPWQGSWAQKMQERRNTYDHGVRRPGERHPDVPATPSTP